MRELAYATTWDMVHPPALELAARIAGLAPGDLDRVFFTSGGSESVESALKLVRTYHQLRGEPRAHQDRRPRARLPRHHRRRARRHGPAVRARAVRAARARRLPRPAHGRLPQEPGRDPLWAADAIEHRIVFEGPETVAAVILEPVQNSGGCLVPPDGYFQRVREICDRHGVLLISDDTICSWGRLGHLVRRPALRLRPRRHHDRQGDDLRLRADGRGDRLRAGRRPVPGAGGELPARPDLRRPPGRRGGRAGQHRPDRARGPARPRARQRAAAARRARAAARHPARRRRARRGLLLGHRARRRPRDQGPVRAGRGQGGRRRPRPRDQGAAG